jgi:hypothetical protein
MKSIDHLPPLIGPTVAGPLGLVHLPRMWYKGVLSAAGMLYENYFDNYKGFNQRVVDAIGLDPEPWFAFLATMPTYPEAEAFVRKNATKLDAATIAATNTLILDFPRPEENAAAVRARVGIDDPALVNSCTLLNYDDWFTMHAELMAHRAGGIEPLVPMVSSGQTGLLGVQHLPRLWMKALLSALGALAPGWKTGTECGFDNRISGLIGMDLVAATDYIKSDLPTYGQFEAWVRDHIAQPTDAQKAEWTTTLLAMQKPEEMSVAECGEVGLPGSGLRGSILLNDLVDWKHMHDHIVSQRTVQAH